MELVKSLAAGAACGVVFSLAGLPIPAPPVLAGVVGIIGVFAGYVFVQRLRG
jgi:XapX domain-containing protein